jgi:hypothetical protein
VDGYPEVGVEGHDLVHVPATEVHRVGQRVGQLGGDRADLAPDPAEVVEELRALLRQLAEHGRELEDVHN